LSETTFYFGKATQTSEKGSDFRTEPEDDGHENAGQDDTGKFSPVLQAFPAPA